MRKTIGLIFVLVFTSIFALLLIANIYAQESQAANTTANNTTVENSNRVIDSNSIKYENTPVHKLGRGLINMGTFWLEVPAGIIDVSKEKDPFMGFTFGLVKGVFTGLLRGFTGICDTVTFIIPPYNQPLMKPEFMFTSMDQRIKENAW